MNAARKKKLESQGWKIGTVQEFLGLSHEESALIEIKLALSRELRKRREARMTQKELAKRIHSSQPRIVRALLATDATPKDIARIFSQIALHPVD